LKSMTLTTSRPWTSPAGALSRNFTIWLSIDTRFKY
jgi:hypothetical protein